MPAYTTPGLILKRTNFGEADRMITSLTQRFGKISIVARGVRRIKSRRAGNIEVLNVAKLHLFHSRGYTLTEAEAIETFPKIKANLTLSTTAFHVIELIDRLVPEGQKNENLFELAVTALKLLQQHPRQIFIRAFEVKLLGILGFWGTKALRDVDYETAYLLDELSKKPWTEINKIELSALQAQNLEDTMRMYLEKVLESPLKSAQVMDKLKA
jgi:DNA repair protein RecO (recombination protein O)